MKFFVIAGLLLSSVQAFADVSFKVNGIVVKNSRAVAGSWITTYELRTEAGDTVILSQKQGVELFQSCRAGTFELVASSPLPGAKLQVIGTENCSM